VLDRLVQQYRSGHYKFAALRALANCDVSKEVYLRLVPTNGLSDDVDHSLVRFLAADEEARPAVRHHLRELIASSGNSIHDIVELLDPTQQADQERLWEQSLQPSCSGIHVVGSRAKAVRSLGAVARDAAFEIGVESLSTDARDRDSMTHLLMELNPQRAIDKLCSAVRATNDKVLCCAIGRAFRENASSEQLRQPLTDVLNDSEWKARRAGAFIASFLTRDSVAEELVTLAYGDPKWAVCAAAQHAIRSHQRETEATKLSAALGSIRSAETWATIGSIVQLVDPGVLALPSDPIGFLAQLREQPFLVRKYASDAINKRREQLERDMNSRSGKWKDED
jgi:hypothetical protein